MVLGADGKFRKKFLFYDPKHYELALHQIEAAASKDKDTFLISLLKPLPIPLSITLPNAISRPATYLINRTLRGPQPIAEAVSEAD